MNPDKLNKTETSAEGYLLHKPQDIIRCVHDNGYVSIESEDVKSVDGGEQELLRQLKEADIEEYSPGLYYNPKRIQFQTVNTEKGLDPKYAEEGWTQLERMVEGRIALLVRKIK